MENSQALKEATDLLVTVQPGEGRTASGQALFQLAALFTTIAIAVVGGAVTGNHLNGIVKFKMILGNPINWK